MHIFLFHSRHNVRTHPLLIREAKAKPKQTVLSGRASVVRNVSHPFIFMLLQEAWMDVFQQSSIFAHQIQDFIVWFRGCVQRALHRKTSGEVSL